MTFVIDMVAAVQMVEQHPDLLEPAPLATTAMQMEHRRLDEVHPCFACPERATRVIVVTTSLGQRWLDLCAKHYDALRQ